VCTGTFAPAEGLATSSAGVTRAMTYVDDGTDRMLAVGGEDQIMRVWDIVSSQNTAMSPRLFKGFQEAIWDLEWIPQLNVLATACGDGFIRFWPISVLKVSQPCSTPDQCCDGAGLGCRGDHVVSWRHAGMKRRRQVHSLAWKSSGGSTGTLVTGWSDGSLRTWNYDGSSWSYGTNLQGDVYNTADRAHDLIWLSGASKLASASPDWPHPRLWNDLTTVDNYDFLDRNWPEDPQQADLCNWAHCDATLALDTNAAGDTLVSGSKDNSLRLWNPSTLVSSVKLTSHSDHVTSLVWLHSENLIASGSKDTTIKLWDSTVTTDSSTASQSLSGLSGSVNAMVWIPGFKKLAAADSDGNVKLWAC